MKFAAVAKTVLPDVVEKVYSFRNEFIAHQEKELIDPEQAREALKEWIGSFKENLLFQRILLRRREHDAALHSRHLALEDHRLGKAREPHRPGQRSPAKIRRHTSGAGWNFAPDQRRQRKSISNISIPGSPGYNRKRGSMNLPVIRDAQINLPDINDEI
jgi:hypothetical protein